MSKFKVPSAPKLTQRRRSFYFSDALTPCMSYAEVYERRAIYENHIRQIEHSVELNWFDSRDFGAECYAARVASATPNQRKRLCELIVEAERLKPDAFGYGFNYWEQEGAEPFPGAVPGRRKKFKPPPPKDRLTQALEEAYFEALRDVIDYAGCVYVALSSLDYWGGWLCEWHCREEKRHALHRRDFKRLQEIKPAILTLRGISAPSLPKSDPIEHVCAATQPGYYRLNLYQPHYPEYVTSVSRYASRVTPVVGMLDVIAHGLQITDARRGLERFDSPAYCAVGFRDALKSALIQLPRLRTACDYFFTKRLKNDSTPDLRTD